MSYSYKRTLEFLRLLTRESSYRPVHFYAKALNVSVKSVFYYLAQLDHLLDKNKYLLHKEPGKGIFLEKSQAISLEHMLKENIPIHRQIKILHQLILEHQTATVKELSNSFYVSKTSIICDLKKISADLSMETHVEHQFIDQRIIVTGSFLTIMQLHLLFIDKLFRTLIQDKFMGYKEYLAQLHDYYPSPIIEQSTAIIKALLTILPISLHLTHDINHFSLILLIILYESPTQLDLHLALGGCPITMEIDNILNSILPLHLHDSSIKTFIYYQLIIHHFITPPENNPIIQASLHDLNDLVVTIMAPHLKDDATLQNHLAKAYPLAILQAQLGAFISNHHHETLKNHHATFINVGLFLIAYHHQKWNIPYHATIACSLLTYFLMALYKYQPKSTIYLLSHLDPALHLLLSTKLQNILPTDHHLIEILTVDELPITPDNDDQMIILSTYPIIPAPYKNFLTISPFIDFHEQQDIITLYNSTFHHTKEIKLIHPFKKVENSLIRKWIHKDTAILTHECNIKAQILDYISQTLYEHHYTKTNLHHVLQEIDEINHVDTKINWVFFHLPPEYVEKSTISIYHNNKPVLWHQHTIQNVICTALIESDYQTYMPTLLHEIYLFFRSTSYRDTIIKDLSIS